MPHVTSFFYLSTNKLESARKIFFSRKAQKRKINFHQLLTLHSQLYTLSGRSASRRAFRYIFARHHFHLAPKTRSRPQIPFPNLVPNLLAKDAAAIPNATG